MSLKPVDDVELLISDDVVDSVDVVDDVSDSVGDVSSLFGIANCKTFELIFPHLSTLLHGSNILNILNCVVSGYLYS